jgi:lipid-binding SYLF domain-containing protein
MIAGMIALSVACMPFSSALAKETPARSDAETKAPRKEEPIFANAHKAIKEITTLPKRKIPPVLFKDSAALVIVPKASKQAFMVNKGKNGGILLMRDAQGAWGNPVFISISGGTLGWQIVGDPMDIILLVKSAKQIDSILKNKLTLDSKFKIVSGRVAATMKGATKEELGAEITSYIRSHGVFVEEGAAAGTSLQLDAAANDAFYGKTKVDVGDILSSKVMKTGEDVSSLQKLLNDYAETK